ncbi:MAG TPA: hypothetical protein VE978_27840 [Chitinophagales bacterium]|nr:hypothetical protein [Chitinophagales bacterium]
MKNAIQKSACVMLFLLAVSISANAQALLGPESTSRILLSNLNTSISIPVTCQSQIVRQDFENESIFSFKNEDNSPVFLFSINKVTGAQWMQLKDQVKDYTIIENKDEVITFVLRTDVTKIKGSTNDQYQSMMAQVDGMIASLSRN